MDNRIQRIFLKLALSSLLGGLSVGAWAAESQPNNPDEIYSPEIDQQVVKEDLIDDENFEFGLSYGQLNIEDFGASTLVGVRAAFHINEDFFLSISGGQATAGLTSDEQLFNIIRFTDDERKYTYYDISIGWNILPGEAFIGEATALNTAFYIVAGVGNTEFAGSTEFTYVVGAGYRILLNDWLAFNLDTRDHLFNTDFNGETKLAHNFEVSLGLSVFF